MNGIVEFAAQKLIRYDTAAQPEKLTIEQELACLSAQLPIEFMSSTSTQVEMDQVAHRMHVCLLIDESFYWITSLNPSEPIVSEGVLMTDMFNAPAALSHVLSGFSVHQGDHSELVAMLLLTMARDRIAANGVNGVFGVTPFLETLIPQMDPCNFMEIKPSVYQGPND